MLDLEAAIQDGFKVLGALHSLQADAHREKCLNMSCLRNMHKA